MSLSKRNSAMQRKRVQDMALKAGAVAMALPFVLASALSVHAQASKTQQSQQILSPVGETSEHDQFGTAVAISRNGNTMVIGSETADGNVVAAGAPPGGPSGFVGSDCHRGSGTEHVALRHPGRAGSRAARGGGRVAAAARGFPSLRPGPHLPTRQTGSDHRGGIPRAGARDHFVSGHVARQP